MVCKNCGHPIARSENPRSVYPLRHIDKSNGQQFIMCGPVSANKGKLLGASVAEPMEVKDYLKLLKKHGV